MKLKELESELQPLKGFSEPKRELEQYVTSSHLASRMIFTAATQFDDIEDKIILDLGCGCAVLSIACMMMGADGVASVDADSDALEIAKENIESVEMEEYIQLHHAQIGTTKVVDGSEEVPIFDPNTLLDDESDRPDTCVMNPPFGTWNKGIDALFLEVGCKIAKTAVYSLNKSSTRDFLERKAKSLGFKGTVIAQMRYDLPKTMAHHKQKSVDIEVDMWRFERIAK
ncbi:METTL5 family protein [Sporobolomyces salmoneus]|uniref:METTL5 family protein n=1 Tax=Sporobolomyces salmoneus TaxID=183962 RepID=UPI00316CDB7C